MEWGSQYKYSYRCRGEVFWIHAIDNSDGMIRTCSRVGIYYSYMKNKNWWLSTNGVGSAPTDTKTCPGSSAASMQNGGCGREAWRIYVLGQPCGVLVKDRDLVRLISEDNGRAPLAPFMPSFNGDCDYNFLNGRWDIIPERRRCDERCWFIPNFIIFRSDVDREEYSRNLPCK